MAKCPKEGELIYIGSGGDYYGGKAIVSKVKDGTSGGFAASFVEVEQAPGTSFNWQFLGASQERLKRSYGHVWAHPDYPSALAHYSVHDLKAEIEKREEAEKAAS